MKDNMEWQVMFEVCRLFRELQETYQFSGLLAKCLVWSELGYYIQWHMNINEFGQDGLDIGLSGLGDLGQLDGLGPHAY